MKVKTILHTKVIYIYIYASISFHVVCFDVVTQSVIPLSPYIGFIMTKRHFECPTEQPHFLSHVLHPLCVFFFSSQAAEWGEPAGVFCQ